MYEKNTYFLFVHWYITLERLNHSDKNNTDNMKQFEDVQETGYGLEDPDSESRGKRFVIPEAEIYCPGNDIEDAPGHPALVDDVHSRVKSRVS